MRDAGFKDVQVSKYKIPIGPWAKDPHLVIQFHAISPLLSLARLSYYVVDG